jgi:lipopolysaccharide export system permease protein
MTIGFYILKCFIRAAIQVQVVLFLVIWLILFVENLRMSGQFGHTAGEALWLTALQLPEYLSEVFPLVLLLAALVTVLRLNRSSELVVFRASGISAIRVLFVPVLAALVLGIGAFSVINPIVAVSRVAADEQRDVIRNKQRNVFSIFEGGVWLRQGTGDGQSVIQAGRLSPDGNMLFDVRIHDFDAQGRMTARHEAASARLGAGEWVLYNVRSWTIDPEAKVPLRAPTEALELHMQTDLTSEQILERIASPEIVPFWKLPQVIRQLESAGFSARRHQLFFQSELARPLFFAAMVLIGAGFSLRHMRFGNAGIMMLFAVLAGFLLYFFSDISESLGNAGTIPVTLAAWAPAAIGIMLAIGFLLHVEDG